MTTEEELRRARVLLRRAAGQRVAPRELPIFDRAGKRYGAVQNRQAEPWAQIRILKEDAPYKDVDEADAAGDISHTRTFLLSADRRCYREQPDGRDHLPAQPTLPQSPRRDWSDYMDVAQLQHELRQRIPASEVWEIELWLIAFIELRGKAKMDRPDATFGAETDKFLDALGYRRSWSRQQILESLAALPALRRQWDEAIHAAIAAYRAEGA